MKSINILLGILLSIVMVSCGADNEVKLAEDTRPTVNVTTSAAILNQHNGNFTVSGKIQAENIINVSARMMGALTSVTVKVGDRVSAGQTLATINNTDIQAKAAQADAGIIEAQSALTNIKRNYDRIKNLYDKQSATQKELDDISTQRDVMKAKIRQAQEMKNGVSAMMSYTVVTAPFSGIITQKHVSSGDLASPGKPLFSLESGNTFQAEVMIPEQYIGDIHKGDKVKVILKSSDQELNGTISEQSFSSLNTGGQYLVKVKLDRNDVRGIKLFSGMYANVIIPQKGKAKAETKILVDKSLIISKGQLNGLYTISDQNTAILRWVRLGNSYGDKVEILSGLSSGEQYIISHDGRLLNGVKLNIN